MSVNYSVINSDEEIIFKMRSLYKKYGYSQFKMSKFEEYDLYVRNKDFLVSENIITFTDTDGKLMALKPDVTLSIIKNTDCKSGQIKKVFYDENVYRVSKGTNSFKELMQVGLECIGDIDTYNIFETIMMAAKSLESISNNYVLDLSNMDIILNMIDSFGLDNKAKKEIIKCIGEKNVHGINEICLQNEVDINSCEKLKKLISLYGGIDEILDEIKDIVPAECANAVSELEQIVLLIKRSGLSDKIRIDFSVISDNHYYNGFVFKGFIKGVSSWILSGGQYDNLMRKMRIESRAIGFAVYLDMLDRFYSSDVQYDIDCVILYESDDDIVNLNSAIENIISSGKSVIAVKEIPENMTYKQLLRFKGNGGEIIEANA